MATEYKLSYTASEIDEKLGKIDKNTANISKLSEDISELKENGLTYGIYVGNTQPTNGVMYWLDTSDDTVDDEEPETEVTLSSISATYSGGSVVVGTDASALTGITVTANYSDGSTAIITDYILSGTIAEGSNTITITYEDKTTTISVIGYVEGEEEITLSSISATYTGGEVTVGTSVSDLAGITVTGTYSDGSTSTITGYTLSGEIVEGENTITVTYDGLTTTFTVTGVAESSGEVEDISSFVIYNELFGDNRKEDKIYNTGYDFTSKNNMPIIAPVADYLKDNTYDYVKEYVENEEYDTMYAVVYYPNRTDQYGALLNILLKGIGESTYQFDTIGTLTATSAIGETEDYKVFYCEVIKSDVLAGLNESYDLENIREIIVNTPNVGAKNYNTRVVWMKTKPTEEQCIAIRDFFENGGVL